MTNKQLRTESEAEGRCGHNTSAEFQLEILLNERELI